MYIAKYLKQIPPKEWYHNRLIHNKYDLTVAYYLVRNEILPPKEWKHTLKEKLLKYRSLSY